MGEVILFNCEDFKIEYIHLLNQCRFFHCQFFIQSFYLIDSLILHWRADKRVPRIRLAQESAAMRRCRGIFNAQ